MYRREIGADLLLLAQVQVDLNVCSAQSHLTHFTNAEDTFDTPKCHAESPLSPKIMDWILGFGSDQNAVVLWFYGSAGAGKSAIAHNLAERCDLENLLLTSFFFSPSDPMRSNTKSPISYQIAINTP